MNLFRKLRIKLYSLKRIDTPVKPWAFIRVFSEMKTFPLMLESIRGAVDRGVIATHLGNLDETVEFAKNFCKDNPGFVFFEYPHQVIPAHDERYKENPPYENTLAAYYNAALAHIPLNEWFIKLDGDEIFDAKLLNEAFELVTTPLDNVAIPRLNVAFQNGKPIALSYMCPRDQWILKKRPGVHFKNESGYKNGNRYYAYEVLVSDTPNHKTSKALAIHFPYEKTWRSLPPDLPVHPLETIISQIPESEYTDFMSKENVERVCQRIIEFNK